MDRKTITTLVKANKGKIVASGVDHINYRVPMTDKKFLELREAIPFLTLWHTGNGRTQSFGVFFDQLRDY